MNQKDFGLRLKELRLSQALTQSQLSNMIGVSRQAYVNYESGRTIPPAQVLSKLSQIFSTNLMEFLYENTTHSYTDNQYLIYGSDRDDLFSLLELYSKLSPLSKKRILTLITLMAKGGEHQ